MPEAELAKALAAKERAEASASMAAGDEAGGYYRADVPRPARHGGHAAIGGGLHAAGDCDHHRPFAARCRSYSGPLFGADNEARGRGDR
jgi:hypothetical protein